MNILIASGFFESELPSYREYSYSKELSELGHDVTLMCGDQSQIWTGSRVKISPTNPTKFDALFVEHTGVRLLRRHVWFRYSDFVLYFPDLDAIRKADIVHVVEFRQGVTLLIALLAWLFNKKVVYDHEQRGDRKAKWYSRIDSYFRRMLISLGSITVSQVRHTVLANRDHFRSCALRNVDEVFAPLGANPNLFYFDENERARAREKFGLPTGQTCAIVSGKLHILKLIPDVIEACRTANIKLILVGSRDADVENYLAQNSSKNEIVLDGVSAAELRELYNAADIAIFTTFTLSYWEALATGISLVIPRTEFTEFALGSEGGVRLYGNREMFLIPDEQYHPTISIAPFLAEALGEQRPTDRVPNLKFSAALQASKLEASYKRLLGEATATS